MVGFEGIAQTPLRILPPSRSPRLSPGQELVVVEEGDFQQCEDEKEDVVCGDDFNAAVNTSWEESCLARFSKFFGFSAARHEEEILGFMKRFNARRQKGEGKGGDGNTKFVREMKKLEWNVTVARRKKDGAPGKGARASYHGC